MHREGSDICLTDGEVLIAVRREVTIIGGDNLICLKPAR